ncbi:uncharacterized protein [Asterias amurensis]|uniref:uncharacterized protein isoform X2 n=1 Tax=Asterias amurensis TaxID=7602 RepID=UPI003AB1306B
MTQLALCLVLLCLGVGPAISASTDATTPETTTVAVPTTVKATTVKATTTRTTTGPTTTTTGMTTKESNSTDLTTTFETGSTANMTTGPTVNTTTEETNGTTTEPTTFMRATTQPVTMMPGPTRYEVNDTDGRCILMQFYAKMDITYSYMEGNVCRDAVSVIDVAPNSVPSGNCSVKGIRSFAININDRPNWFLRLEFTSVEKTFELTTVILEWKYETPYFNENATCIGELEEAMLNDTKQINIKGSVGNTYQCTNQELTMGSAVVTFKGLMFQPFADESEDKGNFGDVETCEADKPTNAPSKTDNTGMIVGIVIGVLALVIIVGGGAFFLVRSRAKRESYKSLD